MKIFSPWPSRTDPAPQVLQDDRGLFQGRRSLHAQEPLSTEEGARVGSKYILGVLR